MGKKKSLTSRVTDRGQVTIPSEIRRRLGIGAGTKLRFHTDGGKLVAVKEALTDPVSRVYGVAGKGSTEKIMSQLRGDQ
jgi:AbrB family looped-hinge helix DNA binding protein